MVLRILCIRYSYEYDGRVGAQPHREYINATSAKRDFDWVVIRPKCYDLEDSRPFCRWIETWSTWSADFLYLYRELGTGEDRITKRTVLLERVDSSEVSSEVEISVQLLSWFQISPRNINTMIIQVPMPLVSGRYLREQRRSNCLDRWFWTSYSNCGMRED